MRRRITVVIVIAFNCIVILAQQTVEQSVSAKTPAMTGVTASNTPPDDATFQSSTPHLTFGRFQTRNLMLSQSGQSAEQKSPFVFVNGAVYMTALGGRSLIPMPGGGASGCFSLDLAGRITNLEEFLPKLGAPERTEPKPHIEPIPIRYP